MSTKPNDGFLSNLMMRAILTKLKRPYSESTTPQDYKDINQEIEERLILNEKIGRWMYKKDGQEHDIFAEDDLEKSLQAPDKSMVGKRPEPGHIYRDLPGKKTVYPWLGYRTLFRVFKEEEIEKRVASREVKKLLLVYLDIPVADFYQYLELNQELSLLSGGWDVYGHHPGGVVRHYRLWIIEPARQSTQTKAKLAHLNNIIGGQAEIIGDKSVNKSLVLRFEREGKMPVFWAIAPLTHNITSQTALEAATLTFDGIPSCHATLSVLLKVRSRYEPEFEFLSQELQYSTLESAAAVLPSGVYARLKDAAGLKANMIPWEDQRYTL